MTSYSIAAIKNFGGFGIIRFLLTIMQGYWANPRRKIYVTSFVIHFRVIFGVLMIWGVLKCKFIASYERYTCYFFLDEDIDLSVSDF